MGKRNRDAPRGRRQVLQLERPDRSAFSDEGFRDDSAVTPPIPTQWQQVVEATTGDVYYWNTQTGETTWERPAELDGQVAQAADIPPEQDVDAVLSQMEADVATVRVSRSDGGDPPKKDEAANALALMGGYDSDSDEGDAEESIATARERADVSVAQSKTSEGEPDAKDTASTSQDKGELSSNPDGSAENGNCKDGEKKPLSFSMQAVSKPKGDAAAARAALKELQEETKQKPKEERAGEAQSGNGGRDDGDVDDFLKELEEAGAMDDETKDDGQDSVEKEEEASEENTSRLTERGAVGTEATKSLPRAVSPVKSEENEEVEEGEVTETAHAAPAGAEDLGSAEKEEEDRRVMEECFHTVLSLREEGDALVSRLKASVAEEDPVVGGRRDVLLTLLGGMLSWCGCVQELGLLVSQELSGHMSRAALSFLAKLKQRLEKCSAELDKQEAARSEEEREVLPLGWKRMVGSKDGSILYCHETKRLMQTTPPSGTTYKRAMTAAEEARREEEEKHEALIAALPSGEGDQTRESLLVYLQPETDATVQRVQSFFPHPDPVVIRIIGSGFVAVTFTSDLECELARDQALAEHRGVVTDLPSLLDWALLSCLSPVVAARCACKGDKIDRYPISYKRPDLQPRSDRSVSPAVSPFVSDHSPSPALGASHGSSNPWDSTGAPERSDGTRTFLKGKPMKGKVGKKGFSQQLAKWRQKQSEMEPEEEEKPMTLAQLEEDKKRKAHEWFKEQLEAGADGAINPNLIPVKRKKV